MRRGRYGAAEPRYPQCLVLRRRGGRAWGLGDGEVGNRVQGHRVPAPAAQGPDLAGDPDLAGWRGEPGPVAVVTWTRRSRPGRARGRGWVQGGMSQQGRAWSMQVRGLRRHCSQGRSCEATVEGKASRGHTAASGHFAARPEFDVLGVGARRLRGRERLQPPADGGQLGWCDAHIFPSGGPEERSMLTSPERRKPGRVLRGSARQAAHEAMATKLS